jgi:hypothetical protein
MEDYEVITSDESKLGPVVEVKGDNLIVERGLLRKSRHAIPKVFAEEDGSERVVRLTVSEELVQSSPKLEDGEVDERAVAEHYGLAAGDPAPPTQGYGELRPDDPARTAEDDRVSAGMEPAEQQRVRIREGAEEPGLQGKPLIPPDTDASNASPPRRTP